MKQLCAFAFTFVFTFIASAMSVQNYNYPYQDPYMSSLTYEIMQANSGLAKSYKIPGMASRNNIPLFENRNYTRVNVYKQKSSAPLAFMLTGTGSNSEDPGVNNQAEILYSLGYSVIVFPSPISWKFVLAENPTAVPGYTPDDSQNLYDYMQKVLGIVNADHSMQISGYVLVGYSLGAGEAAFVSVIDEREQKFNFEKILLVNPPFDMLYSVSVIDSLLGVAAGWSAHTISYVQSLVYTSGVDLAHRDYKDPLYFYNLDKSCFGNTDYDKFLIGGAFRSTLGDDIFVNQQVKDTGILKSPATSKNRDAREAEARGFSFQEYSAKFVVPTIAKEHGVVASVKAVYDSAGLATIADKLAANKKLFIFHNANDFLVRPSDLVHYQKLMGDRMTVFPLGGHLGNLWFPTNQAAFRDLFAR